MENYIGKENLILTKSLWLNFWRNKMTKKGYITLAKNLNLTFKSITSPKERIIFDSDVIAITTALEQDNPSFSKEKFLEEVYKGEKE